MLLTCDGHIWLDVLDVVVRPWALKYPQCRANMNECGALVLEQSVVGTVAHEEHTPHLKESALICLHWAYWTGTAKSLTFLRGSRDLGFL